MRWAQMAEPAAVPADWRTLLGSLPGYDPFAQADGCRFDAEAAQLSIDFTHECICHVEGDLAGKPFLLERWQQAIFGNLFGWKRKDRANRTVRRYREALIYVPRKCGKTPMAAVICLYVLFCDGEAGAQIYSAAAEREQASYLFRQAKGMVEQQPVLSARAKIYGGLGHRSIVLRDDQASVYKVLSADAETKHGGNSHLVLIDELHAQPNRELVDVLQTSMASENRKQPLLVHITTADFARPSICNEKYDYACKVRDNGGDRNQPGYDPSFLPVIYEAAAEEDWRSPAVWAKANPNLGVSVSLAYLERECRRAVETPTYENTFKRLHLNLRTEQDVRFLQMEAWDRCAGAVSEQALLGRFCYSGLDLSSKIDLTAHVLIFPPAGDDACWRVLPRFWLPRETAVKRERESRIPYATWARQGFLTLTEGNVVDYDHVKASILQDAKRFILQEIAYDPWNATQIALQLQSDGATMVEFRQGYASMSEPTKELEKLVVQGRLAHGGHPLLRWMAGNVAVETDPAGNYKPSKRKSTEKIDGIVALIMGLGRAIAKADDNWFSAQGGLLG